MLISPTLWSKVPLPPSVAPSFTTCNLSRWYELEVSVGLSWGSPHNTHIRPELTVQPIRLKVDVYSGIAPSPALVNRFMSQRQSVRPGAQGPQSPRPPAQPPRPGVLPAASAGPSAGVGGGGLELDPGAAGPSSTQAQAEAAPAYDEPPPSYEDAMAEDLAPVDGFRQDYHVPESAPVADRKRRDS